jgi:hypothetical protein
VRVKILCRDASKVEGNTLLHINGQGYMIRWCSEKVEATKSKFDRHKEDTYEEGDKESGASHDSAFERLAKEEEEEERRTNLSKARGNKQVENMEMFDGEDFNMSQTREEDNHEGSS